MQIEMVTAQPISPMLQSERTKWTDGQNENRFPAHSLEVDNQRTTVLFNDRGSAASYYCALWSAASER